MTSMYRQNIFQDNLNEPDPPREYKDLMELIDFRDFEFRNWRTGEEYVLKPQLVELGYHNVEFLPGETDSFGPLTRVCRAKDPGGNVVWFVYG